MHLQKRHIKQILVTLYITRRKGEKQIWDANKRTWSI